MEPRLSVDDMGKITVAVVGITQILKMYVERSFFAPIIALFLSGLFTFLWGLSFEPYAHRELIFPYFAAMIQVALQAIGVYEVVHQGPKVYKSYNTDRVVRAKKKADEKVRKQIAAVREQESPKPPLS